MKGMLSCQETAQLLSEELDHALPWSKKILLQWHLLMCRYCPGYARQLRVLHRVFHHMALPEEEDAQIHLSASAKQRIKESLRQEERLHH